MRSHSLDEAYLDLSAYLARRLRCGSHERARFFAPAPAGAGAPAPAAAGAVAAARDDGGAVAEGGGGAAGGGESSDARGGAVEAEDVGAVDDVSAAGGAAGGAALDALHALAEQVVTEIRGRVKEATGGLTTSAGLAHNLLLAKISADQRKPDGQFCPGWSREEARRPRHHLA